MHFGIFRNAPTKLLEELGYGKGYQPVGGEYMPDELIGVDFFKKS